MIWYFLAGMVAGAVGMTMYARWWMSTHIKEVTREEMLHDLRCDQKADEPGCCEGREVPSMQEHGDRGDRMEPAPEPRMADQEQEGRSDGCKETGRKTDAV